MYLRSQGDMDQSCRYLNLNYRYAGSAIVGAILFLIYFQPFLPYAERDQFSPKWWPLPVTALISGFLLSLGVKYRRFWIPTCLLLTLFSAYSILIVADLVIGGVDHNLLPIELAFIAVLASPAYLGTALAAAFDWLRIRRLNTQDQ